MKFPAVIRGACTGFLLLLAGGRAAAATDLRPNIVLFISDQHFADVMGCAGYDYVKTPALDGLAAAGVRFTGAYCTYPVCMASRASLMTGRWSHELKNAGGGDEDGEQVKRKGAGANEHGNPDGKSLGTLMKEAGYTTAYFGKWHVGGVSARMDNTWHGFDTLSDGRRDEVSAAKAIEFIRQPHDRPYFLVVSFLNPHDICEWARLRSGIKNTMGNGAVALEPPLADCPPLPPNFALTADEPEVVALRRQSQPDRAHPTVHWGETEWRQYRWAYARLIEKMDAQVGRVLDAVNDTGAKENTLIAYTSDHGDGDSAHHWNQKMVLFEEAVRVPMIVSWPGHTAAGRTDGTHLVSMGLDLLPTFCDFAGVAVPAGLTGRSLRPWLQPTGGTPAADGHDFVVTEVTYANLLPGEKTVDGLLLRSSHFTYMLFSAGKNPEQLFDLATDPGQQKNLAANPDYQARLTRSREQLRGWIRQTKSPFPLARIP